MWFMVSGGWQMEVSESLTNELNTDKILKLLDFNLKF